MADKKRYKALVGINYVPVGKKDEVRKEPGAILTDLPPAAVKTLLAQGSLEEVK
jgi:hypothetical protein